MNTEAATGAPWRRVWQPSGAYVQKRLGPLGSVDGVEVHRARRLIHCDSDEPDRDEDRDVERWRYRAKGPEGWRGPWRMRLDDAFGDIERPAAREHTS